MSRPEGAELKRVNSYQWPAGHVGHLSEGQQAALQKFKALSKEKGYYEPGDEKTPASHDDETMLRYLRARKFMPDDAFGQFKDTEDWRKENQLDTLYETIDIEEYEQTRKLYPQWTGRMDKRGIPLYVFEVAGLNTKDINAYQNDEDRKKEKKAKKGDKMDIKAKAPRKMLRLFALYENLCRFVLPLCSAVSDRQATETPVSQSANIVDLSKVGLKQFWTLRAHLQDSSSLATAHYPETLDRIFVIGAPSFFNTIWDWAKGWFDPITVSKIFILNDKNMLSELSKVVDVENIPKKYGGQLDWNFGDMPYLGPSVAESLRWKEVTEENGHKTLPKGPIRWEYDEDGDLVAIAIGTEAGKPRRRVLAGLHPDAGVAKLALSPGRQNLNRTQSALFATVSGQGAKTEQNKAEKEQLANGTAHQNLDPTSNTTTTNPNVMSADNVNPQTTEASALPVEHQSEAVPSNSVGTSNNATTAESATADAYEVPYRDPENAIAHPPEDARQGTSLTRQVQQNNTHAEGILDNGTPHTRVDGQGTEHSVMEPRTVGQAPKETPITREEESQPTIIEQVQDYAGQAQSAVVGAVGTVAGAVGLGGAQAQAEEKQEEVKKEDPRVDDLSQAQLEEFLRAKSSSQPEKLNGKKIKVTS
ncbi:Putative CRAL-TRIO lipid binding domain, CRAL/TRIO domain, CRAL/TRIO domain superfamily [Septoria linicola]|uniref:CRAL-TRIO lipid binding domain, CRAL/TRIO domain, CRAL/TRIO domain superfamily n=1 Tax=Septoria linicola TaxID=215465 RepID=A0A9Q9EPY6_9PEZI|nr:putative CRAL-TRIO lipid binding domain, CRAL/TRIO domain, CRAL/TRIO domain superfamily [Septoria linicola]USW59266.1 Putative CRAL-TRIO lipid binding domain, CRAL/TRIO domain, CRAL/TRIO domain superfamily [Septoria linicola]